MAGSGWFVDNAATGTNAGTSWANAWESFSAIVWASVSAGDTIYISGGSVSKTYTAALTIGKSGGTGTPITITRGIDSGHTGTPIIDGQQTRSIGVTINNRTNVVVKNLDVRNHTTSGIDCGGGGGTNVVIENCTVLCGNTTGAPRGIDFRGCSGFTIRGNTITTPASTSGQTDCMVINEVDNFLIEFNTCTQDNTNDAQHSDAFQFWDVDLGPFATTPSSGRPLAAITIQLCLRPCTLARRWTSTATCAGPEVGRPTPSTSATSRSPLRPGTAG